MRAVLQKFATPIAISLFIGVGMTGTMQFFRIGRGTGGTHQWMGIIFVCAALVHLIRNWRPFTLMLRSPASRVTFGMLATGLVATIVYYSANAGGLQPTGAYRILNTLGGASLNRIAPNVGLTGDEMVRRLRETGQLTVTNADQTVMEIARANKTNTLEVFMVSLYDQPPPGVAVVRK